MTLVLASAAGALLAVGLFLGLYVRPTSDDWCAAWKARDMGVFGITSDFYMTQNGRVTNAFLSGIVYSNGIVGPKILPALIVLSLTAGLFLLGREVLRLVGWKVDAAALLAVVLTLQVLLFFAGTRSYQVLLWAPATISHTLPGIIAVWAILCGIWAARSPSVAVRRAGLFSALLLSFAIGTTSEPFSLVGGLITATVAVLSLPALRLAPDWRPFTWCVVWCTGLLAGLVFLYTSPGARWRRAQNPRTTSVLSPAEMKATVEDWGHMWSAVASQPAYLGALAVGVLLGLVLVLPSAVPPPGGSALRHAPRGVRIAVVVLPVPLVALGSFMVALGLHSGYGPSGWTYARTWMSFLVPMVLALVLYGTLLGRALGRRLRTLHLPQAGLATAAALVVGAAALGLMASLVPDVRTLTTETTARGAAWDAQNARIRGDIARGATDVAYRPLHIGELAEPFYTKAYERDWVSACVSKYYGITRIHRG
ncbi:DUF6056 family protein [Streptomyces sp. NPDC090127]|uniref:DUF6056 family protein n=1 Tax=Streptomyces sp. NPDC090127 TaxID=3365953 RepID=UPI00382012CF